MVDQRVGAGRGPGAGGRRLRGTVRRVVGAVPYRARDRVRRLVSPTSVDAADVDALVAAAVELPAAAWTERGWALVRDDSGTAAELTVASSFDDWQASGWHLVPNHFSSPIPDTRTLPDTLWETESALPGLDLRDEQQVAFLRAAVDRFGAEFTALPRSAADTTDDRYHLDNGAFESVDAEIYYAMIRTHKPATIIEIGAGWSTLLAVEALRANRADGSAGRLVAIEPYPSDLLRTVIAGNADLAELREVPLQQLPLDVFAALGSGDILFIDSSHVLRIGSDVQYEYLEILPRLAPGVLVHVHDIFLPGEYPRDWVLGPEHRFWNEQYLLQAWLADNTRAEVLWGSSWMHRRHPDELATAFDSYDRTTRFPGSFWFRRT